MDIDRHFIAKLAREVAMNIKSREEIRAMFQITEEQFQEIEKNPYYIRARDHMIIEWNGALSTSQRLKVESLALLEENIQDIGARMANPTEPLNSAVEVAKFLARVGGMGEGEKQVVAPAEKFQIIINMGNGETVTYDKPVIDVTPTPETVELPKPP